MYIFQVGLNW